MLTIRKEQFDIFREQAMKSFEGEMCIHLRQFSPPCAKH